MFEELGLVDNDEDDNQLQMIEFDADAFQIDDLNLNQVTLEDRVTGKNLS